MNNPRTGSVLLEVMLATLLAGLVVGAAFRLVAQMTAVVPRISTKIEIEQDAFLAERWLRDVLRHADVNEFEGSATSVRFRSHCLVETGLREPCNVSIEIELAADSMHVRHLRARTQSDEGIDVASGFDAIRFLESAGGMGSWRSRWENAGTSPSALQLVGQSDSLTFRVGGSL